MSGSRIVTFRQIGMQEQWAHFFCNISFETPQKDTGIAKGRDVTLTNLLLTKSLTSKLAPLCVLFIRNITVAKLVQLVTFNGTREFITARQWTQSSVN